MHGAWHIFQLSVKAFIDQSSSTLTIVDEAYIDFVENVDRQSALPLAREGRLVVLRTFSNPLVVGWYVLAMIALGLHLSHGFQSAFQTLGAVKPHWRRNLRRTGFALGWLIALGFMSLPIYAYFSAGSAMLSAR